jgi:hypothetical protein
MDALAGVLRRTLHPGARVSLYLLVAESPEGASNVASSLERERLDLNVRDISGAVSEDASRSGVPERRPDESPVSYVQRVRRERGDVAYKPREWAPKVGLSVSEIERAVAHGAVSSTRKPDGRDHGARLVSAESMLAYLATVDAVDRRTVAPPAWWAAVRPGRQVA